MDRFALMLLGTLAFCPPAQAIDSLAVSFGHTRDADLTSVSATWQWDKQWFGEGHWHLTGYWEAGLAYWEDAGPSGDPIWAAGFTPVLRLRPNASGGVQPYLEAAVGAQLLSRTKFDSGRDLGSAMQFAEHIGTGVTFGDKSRCDLSYRLQHLSNAGTVVPNWGIAFHQVRLSYLF